MATAADVRARVRLGLGDRAKHFETSVRGNGDRREFDLAATNIDQATLQVYRDNGDDTVTTYAVTVDWTLDAANGIITFVDPVPEDDVITVEGTAFGLFSDGEIDAYVLSALAEHSDGQFLSRRYRDGHGFIVYDREPIDLSTLPASQVGLVSSLAAIEGLWDLATDASKDINVQTSEGTSLNRGQRFQQIRSQIDALTEWYKTKSLALGVGLFAPEVMHLRRVSRQTGRLVPVFVDREYDEVGPPTRQLPVISRRDQDPDGPPAPWYPSGYGP